MINDMSICNWKKYYFQYVIQLKVLFCLENCTKNTKDGKGVKHFMFKWLNRAGMCPFLAPAKHILDDVIMCTLKPPNAAIATSVGMNHSIQPIDFWANICAEKYINITQIGYKNSRVEFSKGSFVNSMIKKSLC